MILVDADGMSVLDLTLDLATRVDATGVTVFMVEDWPEQLISILNPSWAGEVGDLLGTSVEIIGSMVGAVPGWFEIGGFRTGTITDARMVPGPGDSRWGWHRESDAGR